MNRNSKSTMDFEKLQAQKKLREAEYFLGKLRNTSFTEEWDFCFSAFLSAWRSVLDLLLFDFVDHHDIGFSRDDKMLPWHLKWAARRLNDSNAMEFTEWWEKQKKSFENNELWDKRDFNVHRGYPADTVRSIFVPISGQVYYPESTIDYVGTPFTWNEVHGYSVGMDEMQEEIMIKKYEESLRELANTVEVAVKQFFES